MLDADGAMLDNSCEDFDSGVFLPCDDAGKQAIYGSTAPHVQVPKYPGPDDRDCMASAIQSF